MVYAVVSKTTSRKAVWVRLPPPAPDRKLQAVFVRLASLGNQIVRDFGRKNQLAIPFWEKKIFNSKQYEILYLCKKIYRRR